MQDDEGKKSGSRNGTARDTQEHHGDEHGRLGGEEVEQGAGEVVEDIGQDGLDEEDTGMAVVEGQTCKKECGEQRRVMRYLCAQGEVPGRRVQRVENGRGKVCK